MSAEKDLEKSLVRFEYIEYNTNRMRQVRLTKENTTELEKLVKESKNDQLTVNGAANHAIKSGLAGTRRKYVKGKK